MKVDFRCEPAVTLTWLPLLMPTTLRPRDDTSNVQLPTQAYLAQHPMNEAVLSALLLPLRVAASETDPWSWKCVQNPLTQSSYRYASAEPQVTSWQTWTDLWGIQLALVVA